MSRLQYQTIRTMPHSNCVQASTATILGLLPRSALLDA